MYQDRRVIVVKVGEKNSSDPRMSTPAFARRRATPSPASTMYSVPLTISRLDDWAWWALGFGPPSVPSVMRRVAVFDGAGLVCAMLSCASPTILMPIRVLNSIDDTFFMFLSI